MTSKGLRLTDPHYLIGDCFQLANSRNQTWTQNLLLANNRVDGINQLLH